MDFLRRFSHPKRLKGISCASAVLRKALTALPEQPKSLALSTKGDFDGCVFYYVHIYLIRSNYTLYNIYIYIHMIIIYLTTLFIYIIYIYIYIHVYIQTSRNKLPNSKCIIGSRISVGPMVPGYPMISWVLNRPFLDRNMTPKKHGRKIVHLHYSHGDLAFFHGSDLLWFIFWGYD